MTKPSPEKSPRLSIRMALLLAVNTLLLVGLVSLLVVDYQRSLAERINSQQVAMAEEATLVLATIMMFQHPRDWPRIQDYIDRACAQMQETTSPGHHIAVKIGETVLQAHTHHRASPAFALAMQEAAAAPDRQAQVDGETILVGMRSNETMQVYISEFTTNVRKAASTQLRSHAIGIGMVGLILTLLINLILMRLVTQPIDRLVQTVRQIGKGEMGASPPRFMTTEMDFLATEIGKMSQTLAKANQRRQWEMAKARKIQHNLLPHVKDLQNRGIHHAYLPAEDVGGDFFDVKVLDEHRVVLYMGDVTGHGVPAAMGASMLKTLFEQEHDPHATPDKVLQKVNRQFHAVLLDGDFATLFMGIIDRRHGTLVYASAGHEIGYVLRKNKQIDLLDVTGLLLGVDPDSIYPLVQMDLDPGDMIVLMTDGLVETQSATGEQFGRQAITEILLDLNLGASPKELAGQLLKKAAAHRGTKPQEDDITLAVLRV